MTRKCLYVVVLSPTPLRNVLCLLLSICIVETVCGCALWTSCLVQTLKVKNAVENRNRFTGHCTGQVARSTHLLYLSLGIPGCSLAHWATVSLSASRFMMAGTSSTRRSQLFSQKNLWNENVAKDPKSQI